MEKVMENARRAAVRCDCGCAAEPFLVRAKLGDRGPARSQPPGRTYAGQRMAGVAPARVIVPPRNAVARQ
jgi:hypothetical protein